MSKFSQILLVIILLLGGLVFIQFKYAAKLSDERDRYKQNKTALLSDIERIKVYSTTMAVDAMALRLTIDEYECRRCRENSSDGCQNQESSSGSKTQLGGSGTYQYCNP